MSEPVRIAIIMEGGAVMQVLSAGVPVEFVTVDYDDDADEEGSDVVRVPQDDGTTELAYVSEPASAEICGEFVASALRRFAKWGDPEWRDSLGASAAERPAGF